MHKFNWHLFLQGNTRCGTWYKNCQAEILRGTLGPAMTPSPRSSPPSMKSSRNIRSFPGDKNYKNDSKMLETMTMTKTIMMTMTMIKLKCKMCKCKSFKAAQQQSDCRGPGVTFPLEPFLALQLFGGPCLSLLSCGWLLKHLEQNGDCELKEWHLPRDTCHKWLVTMPLVWDNYQKWQSLCNLVLLTRPLHCLKLKRTVQRRNQANTRCRLQWGRCLGKLHILWKSSKAVESITRDLRRLQGL